jgi:integrase/recombinase XerC
MIELTQETQLTDWRPGFTAWLQGRGSSAKTIAAYRSDLLRYADWFRQVNHQAFSLDLLTSVDVRAYRVHSLEVEQVKPATWNRRRATLAMLCRYAREMGCISYDPLTGVAEAEQVELPPRWLSRSEQNKLLRQLERNLNAARTPASLAQAARDQAMVLLMLHAGLREGEIVALDIHDITLTERTGRVSVRRGKGDKRRDLPLGAEARRAVATWLFLRSAGGDPVFIGKGSARITTRQVQRRVGEIGRQCGLEVTPHQLRHSFAKRLADDGQPLTLIQQLLGHARLETTAVYIKPGWGDYAAAVENL